MPKHPRRSERVDKHQPVEVTLYRGAKQIASQSKMLNFSPMGVGLLHPSELELGEQFSITLVQADGNRTKLLYSVIYCNPERGGYYIGGEFLCTVTQSAAV